MGINAVWKDEQGGELGRVDDPMMVLSRFTDTTYNLSKTACIRFLDPAGDACFNQLQLPVLAKEFRATASSDVAPAVLEHIQSLLELIERATNQTHSYLWFIGD